MGKNQKIMQEFGLGNIPNLDVCVLAALELFASVRLPKLKIPYKHPLIVGSGNAAATGKIIFSKHDAIFADESSFEGKLQSIKSIDGVVLLSASGSKHAPIIAKCSRKYGKHVTLITNTKDSPAHTELDLKHGHDEFLFPKNREPYTYNTSTYMGPILGWTKEDPAQIKKFIERRVAKVKWPDFGRFKKFYVIVPEKFEGIIRLLNVKFMELFGRRISRDIETFEYVKHATTVVPSDELFISFGRRQSQWGQNRLFIPLPKNAGYGAMMAIGYYVVGQIQKAHPAWFKKNIALYCKNISKVFGRELQPIVE